MEKANTKKIPFSNVSGLSEVVQVSAVAPSESTNSCLFTF